MSNFREKAIFAMLLITVSENANLSINVVCISKPNEHEMTNLTIDNNISEVNTCKLYLY